MNWIYWALPAFALITFGLVFWSYRSQSIRITIAARWMRWIFIGVCGGVLLHWSGWAGYSPPVLMVVTFLGWFLVETAYNWLAISAVSKSQMPLFPQFRVSDRTDFWPKEMRFLLLKDWLRGKGFRRLQFLTGMAEEHEMMRLLVYEQKDRHIRFHLMLLPTAKGDVIGCHAFHSTDVRERRCVTDNIFLPYGGFYPESWFLERNPCQRDVEELYNRHLQRLDALKWESVPFSREPQELLNKDRLELEKLNRQLGFFSTDDEEEEQGRITPAGRYRVWQEIWMLSYLGRALKY